MAKKAVFGGLAAILVVVAVVGTVATVARSKHGGDSTGTLATSTKLSSFCSSTLYPSSCERSLATIVNNSTTPTDVVKAAVQVALDEVAAAFNRSANIGKGVNDSITQGAIANCKTLLDDAADDLRAIALIKPDDVAKQTDDLRTWLSSVMTYIYTCADGFDKPELKEAMDKALQNSTELSSNALAIVTNLGAFVKEAGRIFNISTGTSRRLLGWQFNEVSNMTEDGRRRLLAMQFNELSNITEATRRLLSVTLDEISDMSTDASRQLLSMLFNDVSNMTGEDGGRRRLLGMMFNDASNMTEEDGRRRLLGMMFNEVSNMTEEVDGKRLLLSMLFNDVSNNVTEEDGRRRLLGMMFNDVSNMTSEEDSRRRLLSMQLDGIASISADINRRLLAAEFTDDVFSNITIGKRRLLSMTLKKVSKITTDAKRRLLAIDVNGTPEDLPHKSHRSLAMNINGTPEDLPHKPHRILARNYINTTPEDLHDKPHRILSDDGNDFPEWLPAKDRKLLQAPAQLKPNVVVAQDGSGNFKTITDAVNSIPNAYQGRFVIYVKAGVYNEYVTIPKDKVNIYMYGDGPRKTIVTGNKSNAGGYTTISTRTFSAEAKGFICKSMGFSNTAGAAGHQAVALHVQGDLSVFYNCRIDGYQDTLYVHANRQFFRNCVISGTIDFIFGNSAAVFQNCLIIVRKPMANQQNTVTAQGRTDPNMDTGIVIQNCRIVPEALLFPVRFQIPSYLGRPWKLYARTVVMESVIADFISPQGWMPWDAGFALNTLYYAECANTGPGAGTSQRVKWPGYHVIGRQEATQFTAGPFIDGNTWIQYTGTPNFLGFTP